VTDTATDPARDDARPVALVTGASAGIGAATAERLAADGYAVVLAARRADRLADLAERLTATHGVPAHAVPTDVTDADAVAALAETAIERTGAGGLDAVVASAGVGEERDDDPETLPMAQYRRVMATNVDGVFHVARATLPHLRERDGVFVLLGSFKGRYPSASTPVYAATKWWLRGFARSVAARAGTDGVGVSVINPTGVRTEFGAELRGETNDDRLPAGETLEPETVADAVAFAVDQEPPAVVSELNLDRRDVLARF
jgi:NADP-dependent 3-hydroxy acid dehydrogenase YdfG